MEPQSGMPPRRGSAARQSIPIGTRRAAAHARLKKQPIKCSFRSLGDADREAVRWVPDSSPGCPKKDRRSPQGDLLAFKAHPGLEPAEGTLVRDAAAPRKRGAFNHFHSARDAQRRMPPRRVYAALQSVPFGARRAAAHARLKKQPIKCSFRSLGDAHYPLT